MSRPESESTFDAVYVCGDGECTCGMIWDTDADVLIAQVRGPNDDDISPPSEKAQTHLSLVMGAAVSVDKKLTEMGYDSVNVLKYLDEIINALEQVNELSKDEDLNSMLSAESLVKHVLNNVLNPSSDSE